MKKLKLYILLFLIIFDLNVDGKLFLTDDLCSNANILSGLSIIGTCITVIKILVPVVIIAKTISMISKTVINDDDVKTKELTQNLIQKIIIGALIFFIPTIVDIFFGLISTAASFKSTLGVCEECLIGKKDCSSYIATARESNRKVEEIHREKTDNSDTLERLKKAEAEAAATSSTDVSTSLGDAYYNPNDLTQISNLSSQQLKDILMSDKNKYSMNSNSKKGHHKLAPYSDAYIQNEREYKVNAIFLVCQDSYESGYYNSDNWVPTNCNNLGGIKYGNQTYVINGVSKTTTKCTTSGGTTYAKFESISGYINYHAKLLGNNYLQESAKHYNGKTPRGVLTDYCPSASSSYITFLESTCWNNMKKALQ